jgi:hypothetical protein
MTIPRARVQGQESECGARSQGKGQALAQGLGLKGQGHTQGLDQGKGQDQG